MLPVVWSGKASCGHSVSEARRKFKSLLSQLIELYLDL